jgi:hypothetical protein
MRAESGGRAGRAWAGRVFGLTALALAGAACGDYGLHFAGRAPGGENAKAKAELWTTFEIWEAHKAHKPVAPTASFPDGLPSDFILKSTTEDAAVLQIIPAFSEGEPAAYVLPEIWLNMPEVWLQPWYYLITAWNDQSPLTNRLRAPATPPTAEMPMPPAPKNSAPVFDVGPKSLFYSPFWTVFYALVPPGTPYDKYTSAQQIFDEKLPLYGGTPVIWSVRPDNVGLDAMPVHPYLKKEIGSLSASGMNEVFVDGTSMKYFTEGSTGFRYTQDTLVLEEVPLFFMAKRDSAGNIVQIPGAAQVIGTGPLGARRPAELSAGRPNFGSFTRFHFAVAGNQAEVFDPDVHVEAAAILLAKGGNPQAYQGRVANNGKRLSDMNKGCFLSADFPTACTWLDSQNRIEDTLRFSNIIRTEVTACSPVVFYAGKGVGR